MLSTQDCDVTSLDKETAKENIEHLEIQRESARRLSPFAEPDLVLNIGNTKLHIVKDQLMKESAVFDRMLTSDFKEKDKKEIELDGKNLNDFVAFLRCTLPGIDDDINGNITTLQLLIFILLRKYFSSNRKIQPIIN
jgi:hypothetical protein